MSNNSVAVPSWMVKVIVGTIITLALGGAFTWAANVSSRTQEHETRLVKVETHDKDVDEDIKEVKQDVKEILRLMRNNNNRR